MPSNTLGFSGQEIVNRVINYTGNSTVAFSTFVAQSLPLAEMRFCKIHDWRFLYRTNLKMTLAGNTEEYTLDSGTIGYYMSSEDCETITDEVNGRVIRKVTVKDIRRLDPMRISGSTQDQVTHWAPTQDNKFLVYPFTFPSVQVTVDGYITPTALSDLSTYPTIPYRYQESFIEYVIAMALDRENDDRADGKKQNALSLITMDIRDDLSGRGYS